MSSKKNAYQVGLVTIVVAAVFFATLLWVSQRVGGDMQSISVRFKSSPSMPTLVPGSMILVGGQKAGKITSAELTASESADASGAKQYFVIIKADISSFLQLRSDCEVIAEGPPLGGDGVLKIDTGKADTLLPAGQMIEGAEPAGFGAVLASLSGEFDGDDPSSLLGQIKAQLDPNAEVSLMAKLLLSMKDVNAMTASLNHELASDQKATLLAKLRDVADNISATTGAMRAEFDGQKPEVMLSKIHLAMDTLNATLTTMRGVLQTNEAPINHTFASIETSARNIAEQTDAGRPDSLMAHFKKAGETLNKSLADVQQVTDTTRGIMVMNKDNINRMLANFKETSDHVKNGMKYVLRHPWRLLNEPKPAEIQQQALFDAARSFAEAAARIDDASAKLRSLSDLRKEKIAGDDPELLKIQEELQKTRENYQKAESALWEKLGSQ
jgi:ABC-type transporter Mla subunit MlaD